MTNRPQQQYHQQTEIADLLLPFCEAASISHHEPSSIIKKRVVASLISFINVEALHKRLFGHQSHIEWGHVQAYLSDAILTHQDWMQLLAMLDFVDEPVMRDEVLDLIRQQGSTSNSSSGSSNDSCVMITPLKITNNNSKHHPSEVHVTPLESMRLCMCKAHVASPPWDTICKALLIVNISGLDVLNALCSLLALAPTSRAVATEVLSNLSTFRHTPIEYENDIAFILDSSKCRVREHLVIQSIERVEARAAARRQSLQATFAANKRPSLTQMLQAHQLSKRGGSTADVSKAPNEDNLAGFCKNARLSVNSNHRTKLITYFLVCLPDSAGDKKANVCRVLGCNPVVGHAVASMVIVTPDINALRDAVMGTKHAGAPCEDLRRFRDTCVTGAMINSGSLTWTAVLQLYLASYCRAMVTKDLFTHLITYYAKGDAQWLQATAASPEVDARLNTFARQWPMALSTVVDLMLQS